MVREADNETIVLLTLSRTWVHGVRGEINAGAAVFCAQLRKG